jgi:transcriptional regulator with XRE-family HTH domain
VIDVLEYKRIASTAERLKEAMMMAEKTQADLVRETGLNKSTISRYLSNVCEPKQIAIAKLAKTLRVDEMWLWGYDVPMVKKETATQGNGLSESKKQLLALAESCTEEDAEKLLQMMQILLGKK